MLDELKALVGISDSSKDIILNFCIKRATTDICNYTKQDKTYVEANLSDYIVELAIIRFNRIGTEGLQSEGYSGVSNTFIKDIPDDIKSALNKHRKCY